MSSNSRNEQKDNGQKFRQEKSLYRSERDLTDRAGQNATENHGTAHAEAERWARLVNLRAAIKAGSYRVSALDVADAMFRFVERHDTAARQMYSA